MKYEVKFWNDVPDKCGVLLATLVVDIGTFYDDWETSRHDPGRLRIGAEGRGTAQLKGYGSMYLYEHVLSSEILLLNNWTKKTGKLYVGLTGHGRIYRAKPGTWNDTPFKSQVTRRL